MNASNLLHICVLKQCTLLSFSFTINNRETFFSNSTRSRIVHIFLKLNQKQN